MNRVSISAVKATVPQAIGFAARRPLARRWAGIVYRHLARAARGAMSAVAALFKVVRNLLHRALHGSDHRRWTGTRNLEPWWDARTKQIAQLIPEESSVIEFGAGRRQLKKHLNPSCHYVPSDLIDRGAGTFVCDLNGRPLPGLGHLGVDTAVFGGVLEYLHDLESLTEWLAGQVSVVVASYAYFHSDQVFARRLWERLSRRYYGYMNGLSEEELVGIFCRAGYACDSRVTWTTQRIFRFVRRQ